MCDTSAQATTEDQPPTLAEIVREMTDDGRLIVEFLFDMVQGKMEGATYWHRLEAARQLGKLGVNLPQAVVKPAASPAKPRKQPAASTRTTPAGKISELAEFVKLETDNGREALSFLVDVMRDRVADAKLCHRISAAKELLRYCTGKNPVYVYDGEGRDESFDDVDQAPESSDSDSLTYVDEWGTVLNKDHAPLDFAYYNLEDYKKDRMGRRAVLHIFGNKEALEVARSAIRKFRRESPGGGYDYDYDSTPVENPGDDPYGKGCYGYKALKISYEHNGAIRVANKAVAEYYKRTFKHLLNENGSLVAGADTASLEPGVLQYLERNRHLLANIDGPPKNPDPTDTPVGEGFKHSRDHAQPSTDHGPDRPHVIQEPPNVILSEAEGSPSRDPQHTPTEPSEEPPAPTQPPSPATPETGDKPRERRRPRKRRRRIHLGPPSEDPPDSHPPDYDPRNNRDPDEIRIPLRNLLRITAGPL